MKSKLKASTAQRSAPPPEMVYSGGYKPQAAPGFCGSACLRLLQVGFTPVTSNKDLEVDANVLFLHLDRFDKSAAEADGIVERYVWSLKNMTVSESMPEEFDEDERMCRLFGTARRMKENCLPVELISKCTGLTAEQVNAL